MEWWDLDRRDRVAVATFTRPPRNFMHFAGMGELRQLCEDVADDDSINVLVLIGGVEGFFVAHADVEELAKVGSGEPVDGDPGDWYRALALMESMPQPVVAANNGQAWGGGCEISLAATMRVAARSAHYGQPEVTVGIIPGAGGTQRLPRLIGPARAAEMILSGRVVGADEAARIGLVNAVLPDDGFREAVIDWVEPIARRPRAAVVAAKRAIVEGLRLPFDEGMSLEGRLFLEVQGGEEAIALEREAAAAYERGEQPFADER